MQVGNPQQRVCWQAVAVMPEHLLDYGRYKNRLRGEIPIENANSGFGGG
jgi:hypothetical protein